MRIGEANHNNYKDYIELFTKINVNNQSKNSENKVNAAKQKPYRDEDYNYTKKNYNGNNLQDLLSGHLKNSYGLEGMVITGRSDYKRIIEVSDEMKDHIFNDVKRAFYKYNGMSGDMKEQDAYFNKIHEYIKTVDVKDRAAAAYTLDKMSLDLARKVSKAVKEKVPGWTAGKPVPSEVLDEIFSDESITGSLMDSNNSYKGIDKTV